MRDIDTQKRTVSDITLTAEARRWAQIGAEAFGGVRGQGRNFLALLAYDGNRIAFGTPLPNGRQPLLWTVSMAERLLGELPILPEVILEHRGREREERLVAFSRFLPSGSSAGQRFGIGVTRLAELDVIKSKDSQKPVVDIPAEPIPSETSSQPPTQPQINKLETLGWTIQETESGLILSIPDRRPATLNELEKVVLEILAKEEDPITRETIMTSDAVVTAGLQPPPLAGQYKLINRLIAKLPSGFLRGSPRGYLLQTETL